MARAGEARRGGPLRGTQTPRHRLLGRGLSRSRRGRGARLVARQSDDRLQPYGTPPRQRLADRGHLARGRRDRRRAAVRRDRRRGDLPALHARRPVPRLRRDRRPAALGPQREHPAGAPRGFGGSAAHAVAFLRRVAEARGLLGRRNDALLLRGEGCLGPSLRAERLDRRHPCAHRDGQGRERRERQQPRHLDRLRPPDGDRSRRGLDQRALAVFPASRFRRERKHPETRAARDARRSRGRATRERRSRASSRCPSATWRERGIRSCSSSTAAPPASSSSPTS